MDSYAKRFKIDCSPVAKSEQTIVRGNTRFTVITPCLLRVENQKNAKFQILTDTVLKMPSLHFHL